MVLILACACGDKSIFACNIPLIRRSSTYRISPAAFISASRLGILLPTQSNPRSDTAFSKAFTWMECPSASCFCGLAICTSFGAFPGQLIRAFADVGHPERGQLHGLDYFHVPGAATQVSGERSAYFHLCRFRIGGEQGGTGDDHPRSAETALDCPGVDKGTLKNAQPSLLLEAFDGDDLA